MSISRIEEYFKTVDLDIREKGNNPRFIDQKCAPDVLSFIADCVFNLDKQTFSCDNLWDFEYFQKNAVLVFNKPSPKNKKVSNEYDKFIAQPLDLLSYSGILIKTKSGRKNVFSINPETADILEYIAMRDRNAFQFLCAYLNKMLSDSGFIKYINEFLENQNEESFSLLKSKFELFLIGNSKLGAKGSENGGITEARRIFPKVLNVFSASNGVLGTCSGRLSKGIITYQDLMYNEINFRDIGKLKNISRKEKDEYKNSSPAAYNKFLMQKALRWVKKHHPYSEVNDNFRGKTDEVHHIFPNKKFPVISAYIENLIALTAGQHKSKAHPSSDGNKIDVMYQCVCLRAKNKTISDETEKGISEYSKHNFIYVINTGFARELIPSSASFEDIDNFILEYYKAID